MARIALLLTGGLALACCIGTARADNRLTVRIDSGPLAGSYQTTSDTTICMQSGARDVFSAAWKDFDAAGRALAEAGIEVAHPDAPGAKRGRVRISFGKQGKGTLYEVHDQPLTLTFGAQGARISADVRTPDGIGLHVEAICDEVERL